MISHFSAMKIQTGQPPKGILRKGKFSGGNKKVIGQKVEIKEECNEIQIIDSLKSEPCDDYRTLLDLKHDTFLSLEFLRQFKVKYGPRITSDISNAIAEYKDSYNHITDLFASLPRYKIEDIHDGDESVAKHHKDIIKHIKSISNLKRKCQSLEYRIKQGAMSHGVDLDEGFPES